MSKKLVVTLGEEKLTLEFNMIFGEQIMKKLKVDDPTPNNIMAAILTLNERSTFLMYKLLVYCGMLGHDYIVDYEESHTEEEVGEMIARATPEQLEGLFNDFASEMGFDLKGTVEEEPVLAGEDKKKE